MQIFVLVLAVLAGLAAGAALAWLLLNPRIRQAYDRGRADGEPARAVLEERLRNRDEQFRQLEASLDDARQKLTDTFKALSADALKSNNQAFLDLARAALEQAQERARGDLDRRQQAIVELVKPVRESLEKVDAQVRALESARAGAYASLGEQLRSLLETQNQLRAETGRLVTALRAPSVRGRWGEMQLRRVVEMAGMLERCDFYSQPTASGEEGRLRPDLLVRLPGNKHLIVDAKAPLEAYLDAMDAADEETRRARLRDHARQVRAHIATLGRKSYWDQFDPAPEFVVLFLPGESFFSAALEQDPGLIEFGVEQRIILATPTTLIALLRAAAYGWRQEALAENAAEISKLGRELYKRLSDMGAHWVKLGRSLDRAVDSYNDAVGSLESRVLVSARKFVELESTPFGVEIEALEPVEKTARALRSPEMAPPAEDFSAASNSS
jgi:DNA recombination protein RmuC